MKPSFGALIGVVGLLFLNASADAQKAPSQYFPKKSPIPGAPGSPKSPDKQPPAAPQAPRFKDLPLNSQFFFPSDTNRAYAWAKISVNAAKNTKNGVTQIINAETPVQR